MRRTTRDFVRIALMSALLCAICPLSLPLGGLPLSLATFGVCLCGMLLGPVRACAAVGIYLALGAVGLPVFAGFQGGVARIFDITGGFLLGYLPCAAIAGAAARRWKNNTPVCVLMLFFGQCTCLLCGALWYCAGTGAPLSAALLLTAVPFLLPELIKAAAVKAVSGALEKKPDLI